MDVASWAIVLPLIEYPIHGLNYMETAKGIVTGWIGHNCLVALSLTLIGGREEHLNFTFAIIFVAHLYYSYALVLRHTVEEVVGGCLQALQPTTAASTSKLRAEVVTELLQQNARERDYGDMQMPRKLLLQEWIMEAKQKNTVVFIAGHLLHLCTTQQGFKV